MSLRIPLSSPDITEAEIAAVTAVLRTNSLSLGPQLSCFEDALAKYNQLPYAIAVSSGTAALHLAIRSLDLGEGDEVIVPSFTFIAVANAVCYERAIPIFVDIDPVTLNLDPVQVEAAITPRTRAMIIVHNFGVPAEMDALMAISRRHGLVVIEDACEAIGASYGGQRVGTFGDISTFAFYPNKQMTTGEGGAVLTRDSRIADRVRALRNQGRYPSGDWLQHAEIGYNYRLSEMACAMGSAQLSRLPQMLAKRADVARNYDHLLAGIDDVHRPPLDLPNRSISWFVYVIRLAKRFPVDARDRLLHDLQQQGIGCARYFAPIHLQPAYADTASARRATLPVTESVAQRTLALPFFNKLSTEQMHEIAHALAAAVESLGLH
jgi:perosamine synthetase